MSVAGQVADDDADGFALIEIRLGKCLFKVQGVQEFKCQKEEYERETFERLNL